MNKEIEGHSLSFILVAEDPLGKVVLATEYEEYPDACRAYHLLRAPKVCIYRQDCHTSVVGRKHGDNESVSCKEEGA